ncbi:hypothetical protein SAMD00019534_100520 [Acytostelium subglobosum LB1]|uniref:hypothetical protein n=1 Tax=Acytostelium subglobosum LB1 TaxID=1410327 RepID=UPI000644F9FD|nr:hypothetical protein SAMD00019534_100520 [Acytostelium subglobosum LB1]GAM26877.1 hypothetical protein SAMD00019534_100520 [Acytostelium subglobosum LB1]|eukprot:XP_012750145.1 hypothetical protein SAMD00019534_100520 [Acytostelium subglobosum LB1]
MSDRSCHGSITELVGAINACTSIKEFIENLPSSLDRSEGIAEPGDIPDSTPKIIKHILEMQPLIYQPAIKHPYKVDINVGAVKEKIDSCLKLVEQQYCDSIMIMHEKRLSMLSLASFDWSSIYNPFRTRLSSGPMFTSLSSIIYSDGNIHYFDFGYSTSSTGQKTTMAPMYYQYSLAEDKCYQSSIVGFNGQLGWSSTCFDGANNKVYLFVRSPGPICMLRLYHLELGARQLNHITDFQFMLTNNYTFIDNNNKSIIMAVLRDVNGVQRSSIISFNVKTLGYEVLFEDTNINYGTICCFDGTNNLYAHDDVHFTRYTLFNKSSVCLSALPDDSFNVITGQMIHDRVVGFVFFDGAEGVNYVYSTRSNEWTPLNDKQLLLFPPLCPFGACLISE